ncbi:MAG: ectoine synthase [Salinisphaera sp.]|jgi:L-ectoine synthase|nr:ectoine synthase [Salinisphaera sp.]
MKIVRTEDLRGTDQEVVSPDGWTSVRWLLAKDGMGFSFHETTFPPGLEFDMWYKHHLEAVFCYQGEGSILDKETGEEHEIRPGTVYALDKHDRHRLKARTEMKLVCAFNPPVTGREIHDEDGAYVLPDD